MNPQPPRPAANSQRTGMPRWVIISAVVVAILVAAVVVMMLVGGGNHGPGKHMPSGSNSDSSHAPSAEHRRDHGAPISPEASIAPPTATSTPLADHVPSSGDHR